MAALQSYLFRFLPNFPLRITNHSEIDGPMFLLCSFFVFFTFSVLILSFSLYKRVKKIELEQHQQLIDKPIEIDPVDIGHYLAGCRDTIDQCSPTRLSHSLLFEVLPADSPKWASLFVKEGYDDPNSNGFGSEKGFRESGPEQGKKKKRKAKKKRSNSQAEDGAGDETESWGVDFGSRSEKELTPLYPFTSSSSVMQRKIKQQYDELMKCNESKELTLVQVYKLELEQKRLEEDTFVYNWLQQQLKFSPAYKKMLEIGTCMELMEKSEKAAENTDCEFTDISFEELLAQEKKDSFWQKNGKLRSCSS